MQDRAVHQHPAQVDGPALPPLGWTIRQATAESRTRICAVARRRTAVVPQSRRPYGNRTRDLQVESLASCRYSNGPLCTLVRDPRVERGFSCSQDRQVSVSPAPVWPRPSADGTGAVHCGVVNVRSPRRIDGRRSVAGVAGLEPAPSGFGDRRACQVHLTPVKRRLVVHNEKPPFPGSGGRRRQRWMRYRTRHRSRPGHRRAGSVDGRRGYHEAVMATATSPRITRDCCEADHDTALNSLVCLAANEGTPRAIAPATP